MIRINGYARDIFHRLSLPVNGITRFLRFREGVAPSNPSSTLALA